MDVLESIQHIAQKLESVEQEWLIWLIIGQMVLFVVVLGLRIRKSFQFKKLNLELADSRRSAEQKLATQKHEMHTVFADQKAELKHEIKALNQQLQSMTQETSVLEGKHQQREKDLDNQLQNMQADNVALAQELQELQHRFDHLGKLDQSIWITESANNPPQFVAPFNRRTRLVAFLNLKGGVGKTTLTTNLAAGLATGITGQDYRTLAVDLDFQGSLSNSCVDPSLLNDRRRQSATVDRLLGATEPPEILLRQMIVPMNQTDDKASVIVASEGLDEKDFHQQARFAVQQQECRFDHRRMFHDSYVTSEYDLVFFDCPPRLTTSSINALLAADFIVIPTSLAPHDIDALRRTLALYRELERFDEFRARVLGLVANRTYRGGSITTECTSYEKTQITRLRDEARRAGFPESVIFDAMVPGKSQIAQAGMSGVALGADTNTGHSIYRNIASELVARIQDTQPFSQQTGIES